MCGLGQFADQRGDRFAGLHADAKRLLDGADRSGPPQRSVRAEQQCLDEASGIVVVVEREPRRTSTRDQPLAAESREQRRLAVSGRSPHANQCALAHRMECAHEALAAHHPVAGARRRDLEREQRCGSVHGRHRAGEQPGLDRRQRLARRKCAGAAGRIRAGGMPRPLDRPRRLRGGGTQRTAERAIPFVARRRANPFGRETWLGNC